MNTQPKQPWRRILAFLSFTEDVIINGQVVPGWLATHTEDSKFNYALKRVSERAMKINGEVQLKTEDVEIDHQATGEHGVLLYNPDGSRAYTAEGVKALRAAKAALSDLEFEIEPHYCSDLPELPDNVRELLAGFVVEPAKLEAVANADTMAA
jgi:hypothetical protein